MTDEPKYKAHVFICTRCSYEGCFEQAAVEFRKKVKALAQRKWPKHQVRINASGCLGQCTRGISCVSYPQNRWSFNGRPGEEDKLICKIEQWLQEKQ